MHIPPDWLTCDKLIEFKREALGDAMHEGHTAQEELLDRAAVKLGLSALYRPRAEEPLRSPSVRVFASAGLAFEGSYVEALGWLMGGAADAQSRALARAERAELGAAAERPEVFGATRRL